ncbi:MAG: glycosyltransferase [Anaerolineae bacterium]|nr:glycosyltransferase [Anaerolineae bacterium]
MRIGIITGEYPPMQGGVGAYTHILADEMTRQGESVHIFTSLQAASPDHPSTVSATIADWGWSLFRAVRAWAKQHRLDLLNIQYQTAAFGMSPWIHFLPDRLRPIPVVTTFHDLRVPYLFPKAGKLRPWIVRHLARASDGIIVTNHEDDGQMQSIPHRALIPIGSNILKPLPLDFDRASYRAATGSADTDCLLAYFGLFNQTKGIDVLLDALRDLRGRGLPVRLVMIGGGAGSSDPSNASFESWMHARITALSLQDAIHFTGYLEDESRVAAYLAASEIVVLPFRDGASFRRGSLMAALHHGCAIITTTPSVPIPAFTDSSALRLVPPGDAHALAEAIDALRRSPTEQAALRQGACALASQFEWPQIAQQTLAFFQQIIQQSP